MTLAAFMDGLHPGGCESSSTNDFSIEIQIQRNIFTVIIQLLAFRYYENLHMSQQTSCHVISQIGGDHFIVIWKTKFASKFNHNRKIVSKMAF